MSSVSIRPVSELVAEANKRVPSIKAEEYNASEASASDVLIDLRDIREREREGFIPGSKHCPRGMLEFWADPKSPYHKPFFDPSRTLTLYCASGWRSALSAATLIDMGFPQVRHISDGFKGWKASGGPADAG
ncbi:rhodanese-like domain-containing protein [Euryhalocaulis caribicus]|uniref:rhodanese-like domain-containing protein n=1 Tax=Euryhalocaulis caribicus TaxID=1161401 RepID=UPI0003B5556A|nr:rhodanese-like domain-containing protein [Euryhalocaulis caribicus]